MRWWSSAGHPAGVTAIAELEKLLFGLIALGGDGGHLLGGGLLHLAFAQLHAFLRHLLFGATLRSPALPLEE